MNNLFLILSLIVFAILVLGSLLIWKRKSNRRRRRKLDMAARPERDLYAESYFDNPLHPLSHDDKPDPLFEAPLLDELSPIPEMDEPIKMSSLDTSLKTSSLDTSLKTSSLDTSLKTSSLDASVQMPSLDGPLQTSSLDGPLQTSSLDAPLQTKNNSLILPENETMLSPKIEEIEALDTESILETETFPAVADKKEEPVQQLPAPRIKKPEPKSEMIIALYVVAQRQSLFTGRDVLTVFEDLGLQYGKMKIFHHYGIGELKVQQAIFSIANMMEPGTFNPQDMEAFTTEGLVLFMRLPGPFGGRVAFELMLNNAERLAEALEGTVEDEQHIPLNHKKISALREKIANFEQRSTNLSMLKRFS
jgi:cell division protein ZipA